MARDAVTLISLFGDSPPGKSPDKLFNKTNKKSVIKNENQILFLVLMLFAKDSEIKSKRKDSTCLTFGKRFAINKNKNISAHVPHITITGGVMAKSKPNG